MDKSQMRIRPGFVLGLALLALITLCASLFAPRSNGKARAKIIVTRMEEKALASSLSKYISEMGGATNIDSRFIFKEHIDAPPFSRPYRTNANGEILDFWNTPFHIEIIKVTNLTIRSAGPDQKFGDADDIIFNSLTNGFVKP